MEVLFLCQENLVINNVMGRPAHNKTCQVRVSLKLVIEDGAVCGDEDGAAEGQSVVADAAEEHTHRTSRVQGEYSVSSQPPVVPQGSSRSI